VDSLSFHLVQISPVTSPAIFDLPLKAGDNVNVGVKLGHKYLQVPTKEWNQSIQLNGSGPLEYVANFQGSGSFGQWPLVDFQGSVALDVFIDGDVTGTTEMSKGVRPEQSHTFESKNSASSVCSMQVSLPLNVRRTYLCDAATRKIKEK
jgi:hypothetical protein